MWGSGEGDEWRGNIDWEVKTKCKQTKNVYFCYEIQIFYNKCIIIYIVIEALFFFCYEVTYFDIIGYLWYSYVISTIMYLRFDTD